MVLGDIINGWRPRGEEDEEGEGPRIRTYEVMADGSCRPSLSHPRRRPTPPPPVAEPGNDEELEAFLQSLPGSVTWSPYTDDADLPPPLCYLPAPLDWYETYPPRSCWFDKEGVPFEVRIKWHGHNQASLRPFWEMRYVTPDTVLAWQDLAAAYAAQLGGDENKENTNPRYRLAGATAVLPATPTTISNLTPAAATAPTATPPDGSWAHAFGYANVAVDPPRGRGEGRRRRRQRDGPSENDPIANAS